MWQTMDVTGVWLDFADLNSGFLPRRNCPRKVGGLHLWVAVRFGWRLGERYVLGWVGCGKSSNAHRNLQHGEDGGAGGPVLRSADTPVAGTLCDSQRYHAAMCD